MSSVVTNCWLNFTKYEFWSLVIEPILNPILSPGFHSPPSVRQAASQHLRSRVHGHCLRVWSLRFTSSHREMGQKWRCCHPQWLLQNHCEFIWGSNLTSLTFTHSLASLVHFLLLIQSLFLLLFVFTCFFLAEGAQPAGSGSGEVRRGVLSVHGRKRCREHPVERPAHHLGSRYATLCAN